MKFILGVKEGMTQIFDADGTCHGVTVLRVSPLTVTQVKAVEPDGYPAVQVAAGEQKSHRLTKAEQGHLGGSFRFVKEFRPRATHQETTDGFSKGQTLAADVFASGDRVAVSAVSKGKGFQGGVKRHGFAGGRATHGQKHSLREPGSIGATGFGRVLKGTRMAGRMGTDRITVKNLTVMQVNAADNIILIKGAVPGRRGALVEVRGV